MNVAECFGKLDISNYLIITCDQRQINLNQNTRLPDNGLHLKIPANPGLCQVTLLHIMDTTQLQPQCEQKRKQAIL